MQRQIAPEMIHFTAFQDQPIPESMTAHSPPSRIGKNDFPLYI